MVAEANDANGATTTRTSACEAHVAGIIETSRRCRAITITIANDAVITIGSTTARAPASNEPATIAATPTAAISIANQVRREIRSDSRTQPRSAAIIGDAACRKSTFATDV